MAHYYNTIQDKRGDAVVNAWVTVYLAGTTTKPSIFSDSALTEAKENPFQTDTSGVVDFYVATGSYKIKIEGATLGTITIDYLDLVGAIGTMFLVGGIAPGTTASGGSSIVAGTRRIVYSAAAPTTGAWLQGEIAINTVPASGQPIGWGCSVAGTPGTWIAMANYA